MRNTVAIVGSHPRTRDYAPFDREDCDIWVFNEIVSLGKVPRADAIFQMHKPAIWKNPGNRNDPNYHKWILEPHGIPTYMLEDYPEVPDCVPYPLEAICSTLMGGLFDRRYFTSSIAYAVALAIYQGYSRIELYGVEMETNTEYYNQRDGVFYWVGVAIGRGIEVYIHPDSSLFKSPLYGYEGDVTLQPGDFQARALKLKPLIEQAITTQQEYAAAQERALESAIQARGPQREIAKKQLFAAIKRHVQALVDQATLEGANAEVERYLRKAELMNNAAGEVLFSRQEFEQTASHSMDDEKEYQQYMIQQGGIATTAWKALEDNKNQTTTIRARLAQAYIDAHNEYLKAAYQYGRASGTVKENLEYLSMVDERIRMAGGRKSEEVLLREAVNA